MKNDVVRWSATQIQFKDANEGNNNNNNNDNNFNHNSSGSSSSISNSLGSKHTKRQHVANANVASDTQHAARQLRKRTLTNTVGALSGRGYDYVDAIKCDSKENFNATENSFLTHKRKCNETVFSGMPTTRSRHTPMKQQQQQHYDAQQRTFGRGGARLSGILLLCLQFSVAVFVCTLNVGFALGANVAPGVHDVSKLQVNSIAADLPYELDYEDGESGRDAGGHYTHTWAVYIPNGDSGLADQVARDHGFVNLGKIFDDHYHFAHHKVSKRSLTPASAHQTRLDVDERVHWAKQQKAKSRRKRDFIHMRPSRTSSRALSLVDTVPLNDPKWPQMWYLNRGGGLDMNVVPAWKEGITGKGIVVTILDDGLESDHPDIANNYDPKASYDVNSHDDDPMPHYDMTDSNRHGTRCAGEVAATANNSICAVGIAFGASVGGVRMLDGDVTDAVEARSLSLNPQHIDIYSASWGPDDDGKTVDGPGELASRAFIEGVTKGRNGKGSIFIWASGNGGRELDNCNCDGYTNSIWTLSISSATEEGHVPWYSEKCSSTLATTYSSGGQSEKQVVTTDLHHSCTVSHTGTSASAPLAAGIAALVLESNRNLTWRDLQHIVVRTAKPANLKDPTWSKNGVGRRISHSFGYGLMDAAAMVKVAQSWKTVPEQQRCEINAPHVDKVIPPRSYITLQLTVKHCLSVNYLEHVQAKITLTSQRRGDIQLYLKSPAGTKVTLLTPRVHDVSRSGFNQWPFMSVHTWGESPHGNWQLEIHNEGRYMAQITQWDLIFYGTETPAQPADPVHLSAGLFGNDMEHNDIEYDASGQWRNMQQVGESHVMANDKTNTSCLKATPNQRCLECAPPTYFFNGHCYVECPMHTYAVNSSKSNALNDNSISKTDDDHLQSTDRRRRLAAVSHLQTELDDLLEGGPRRCDICDVSCLRCYGPLNSQCVTCFAGSQLRRLPETNETYCYMFAERSSGNSRDGFSSSAPESVAELRSDITYFLLIIVPAVVVITLLVLFSGMARQQLPCWRARGTVAGATLHTVGYDRVALLPDDDLIEADVDDLAQMAKVTVYKDEIETHDAVGRDTPAIIDCTESSESEDELFAARK